MEHTAMVGPSGVTVVGSADADAIGDAIAAAARAVKEGQWTGCLIAHAGAIATATRAVTEIVASDSVHASWCDRRSNACCH
jgi:hypothetical protein